MHTHTQFPPLLGRAPPQGSVSWAFPHRSQLGVHSQPPHFHSLQSHLPLLAFFPLQSRSLGGGEEVHQELLSQRRYPHGAWESPVELHEDFEPRRHLRKAASATTQVTWLPSVARLQNVGWEQPLPKFYAQGESADTIKMQSLTQQVWGGPKSLHLTSSLVMLAILDGGAHFEQEG